MFSKSESKDGSAIDADQDEGGNVKVMCRFRPFNDNERNKGDSNPACDFHPSQRSVTMKLSKKTSESMSGTNKFTFDRVFDIDSTQREV